MSSSSSSNQAVKGGYFAPWSKLTPSAINTELFTHVYYAFFNPNAATFEFDIDPEEAQKSIDFNRILHAKNPPVKTLFSVGGGRAGSTLFTNMASKSSSREKFISSSIYTARKYGFDGIDLDWEYPQTPDAMKNMGLLLDEWRLAVDMEAKSNGRTCLLLTAAVFVNIDMNFSGGQRQRRTYPRDSLVNNLDWINIMTYDYHGADPDWEPSKTGAHAALDDPNKYESSTSKGLNSWIKSGVPESKVIMGLPLYGRTWKLKDRASYGIGAAADGFGPSGAEPGMLTYAEIVERNRFNDDAKEFYDKMTASAYSVEGDSWIGYDNKDAVMTKIKYARKLGIRGYFFWSLDGDYEWEISKTASETWSA